MTCPSEDLLLDLVEARVTAAQRAALERHLDQCEGCRRVAAEAGRAVSPEGPTGGPGEEPRMTLRRGELVGRYVVLQLIGAGGMGVVYSAYDPDLDRRVALKLLRSSMGGDAWRSRLLHEAQAMARLSHPNVVAVYDVGTRGDEIYIAMELVQGQTLRGWLRERPRRWREVLSVFHQAGRGLEAAHAGGIVHRDFKPENVLVRDDGRVQVTDFGLARSIDLTDAPPATAEERPTTLESVTRTGALLGTPAYMAPEQLRGEPADARTDLFAFCVALYEALAARRPFEGDTLDTLRAAIEAGRFRESSGKSRIPSRIRSILEVGLRASPAARYPSMAKLLLALERDPKGRWLRLGVAAGLAALATAVTILMAQRTASGSPCRGATRLLAGTWDESRRDAIAASMRAIGVAHAPAAWAGAEPLFEQYARDWATMHTDTCEATRVRGEQSEALLDLRMSCLDRRLHDLRATTARFLQPTREAIDRAADAAVALPGLEACSSAEALRSGAVLPKDPEARARITTLGTKLSEARALLETGSVREGIQAARSVVDEARRIDHGPVLAEALWVLGGGHDQASELDAAELALREAHVVAHEHRRDRLSARAILDLAHHFGVRRHRAPEAQGWLSLGRAAVRRLGNEPALEGIRLHTAALLALLVEKSADALRLVDRALLIEGLAFGKDHPRLAPVLGTRARVLLALGRYDEAIRDARRSLEMGEHTLGPEHPKMARRLLSLASAHYQRYEFERVVPLLTRGLGIVERALGPKHPSLWSFLNLLGGALAYLSEFDRARPVLERSLELVKELHGSSDGRVAMPLHNLGDMLQRQGKLGEARGYLERALDITRNKRGAQHPAMALHWTGLGQVELGRGNTHEALRRFEDALRLRERTMGKGHPEVASALDHLGEAHQARRDPRAAHAAFERSLAIREKALGASHPDVGESLALFAEAKVELGDAKGALPLAERARLIQRRHGGDPKAVAQAAFVLARSLRATGGDHTRAARLANIAKDLFVRIPYFAVYVDRIRVFLSERPR